MDTTFTAGTVIASTWLNDVNDFVYQQGYKLASSYATIAEAAADTSAHGIVFNPGTYTISDNTTFSVPIYVQNGAVFSITTGKTLTFSNVFDAGVYQVFSGGGSVVFNYSKTYSGYVEWWGVITNSSGTTIETNNTTYINKALISLLKVELLPADYWVNGTIFNSLENHKIYGAGEKFNGEDNTTKFVSRIVSTSATLNILQVGPATYPGSANDLYQGMGAYNLCLDRSVAPDVTSGCTGLLLKYVLYPEIKDVKSNQSVYGFQYYGTVHAIVENAYAFRSIAGTGGTDIFYGHYVNGSASIGLNSGNASLYLIRCSSELGITISNSVGFYADSPYTDLFVIEPETVAMSNGIQLNGDSNTTTVSVANTDVQIVNPTIDAIKNIGIFINNQNSSGSVEVVGGYYGPASTASACVLVSNSKGSAVFQGGQMLMTSASSTNGFTLDTANSVVINETQILECGAYPVDMNSATSCKIKPVVKNYFVAPDAVVRVISHNNRNTFEPTFSGASAISPYGVQFADGTNGYNEVRATGINSVAVTASQKIVYNGTNITAVGSFGTTNYASGVVA
jgi:hypothetical protein